MKKKKNKLKNHNKNNKSRKFSIINHLSDNNKNKEMELFWVRKMQLKIN